MSQPKDWTIKTGVILTCKENGIPKELAAWILALIEISGGNPEMKVNGTGPQMMELVQKKLYEIGLPWMVVNKTNRPGGLT